MKISNNKNQKILLLVFISSLLITYITHHTMLIIITAFIGFLFIANLYTANSVADTNNTNNQGSLDDATTERSFFDDYRTDD